MPPVLLLSSSLKQKLCASSLVVLAFRKNFSHSSDIHQGRSTDRHTRVQNSVISSQPMRQSQTQTREAQKVVGRHFLVLLHRRTFCELSELQRKRNEVAQPKQPYRHAQTYRQTHTASSYFKHARLSSSSPGETRQTTTADKTHVRNYWDGTNVNHWLMGALQNRITRTDRVNSIRNRSFFLSRIKGICRRAILQ